MGIHSFNPTFKKYVPTAFTRRPVQELKGTRVAVDSCLWTFGHYTIAFKRVLDEVDLVLDDPNPIRVREVWIQSVLRAAYRFRHYEITPLFIFDGKTPEAKKDTQKQRQEKYTSASKRLAELRTIVDKQDILMTGSEEIQEIKKIYTNSARPSRADLKILQEVMISLGYSVVMAEGEGERSCAMMNADQVVDAVMSSDTDSLVFGAECLITQLKDGYVNITVRKLILDKMGLTREQFVDICIALGCDYNQRSPGFGPAKIVPALLEYKSLDNLPEKIGKIKINKEVMNIDESRRLLAYCPWKETVQDPETISFEVGEVDIDYFRSLVEKYNLRAIENFGHGEYYTTTDFDEDIAEYVNDG